MIEATDADKESPSSSDGPSDQALAAAIAGLEIVRDEGPETEPAYPSNGEIEAHEDWAFDSASYDRAQTAQDALERVAAITET